jgi:hypothetical protein
MSTLSFRNILATALIVLLSACGGQADTQAPPQTAAVLRTVAVPGQADPQNPTPDCAPEQCQGLRIIDGNAEAFRVDAQRRAAAEANGDGLPQS